MDGTVRAFLSDRYRRLDNYDLMEAILPALSQVPSLSISSCELTDHKLYLKAVTPKVQAKVRGDVVQAGIVISNSEVGLGAFTVEPMVLILSCMNGMIAPAYGQKKYHIGRRVQAEEMAARIFSDETLAADDRAFWLKARDIVQGALAETIFGMIVDDMRRATENKIEGNPVRAVEILSKQVGFNDAEQDGVLHHLIESADLTMMGLSQAITRTSQDVSDYDRATDLERIGYDVITLKPDEWKTISAA